MRMAPFEIKGLVAFIIVHWASDLIWLTFVSIVVYRTHALWGLRFQEWLFIGISLLLVGFGGWFLISGILLVL